MQATSELLLRQHPTAVLPLGDNQYEDGTFAKFQRSYGPTWGRERGRTHPVPGNHEYLSGASGYYQYFGPAAGPPGQGYYSFDLGTWHLIALNAECSYIGGCNAGSPEERWLVHDLANHHAPCILAFWHQPRFSSGLHGNDKTYNAFWRDLYQAHADVILNGHDHDYERFAAQNPQGHRDRLGIREFVIGTGGASHYELHGRAANSQVFNGTTFGVLRLTLHAHTYDWRFIPERIGQFTDSGAASCHS